MIASSWQQSHCKKLCPSKITAYTVCCNISVIDYTTIFYIYLCRCYKKMWRWPNMTCILNYGYWGYVDTFLWNRLANYHALFIEMWCPVRRMLYTEQCWLSYEQVIEAAELTLHDHLWLVMETDWTASKLQTDKWQNRENSIFV